MKLLHLRYFRKVFEAKGVAQAAKELFISQPALSHTIRHLESELGIPLFYHSGRNIETVVYAKEFYPYTVKALDILEEGIKLLSSIDEKIVTSVILYLEIASVSIPDLARTFMKRYPDTRLTIMQHHLLDDTTNPVLYITSEMKPGMANIPIMKEPIYVAILKERPLTKREHLRLENIQRAPILMLSKGNIFRHTFGAALEAKSIELAISPTTNDPATLRSIVKQGLVISSFPKVS